MSHPLRSVLDVQSFRWPRSFRPLRPLRWPHAVAVLALIGAAAALPARSAIAQTTAAAAAGAAPETARSGRIIVRWADAVLPKSLAPVARERAEAERLAELNRAGPARLSRLRGTADGAVVLALPEDRPVAEVADLATRLAALPGVAWAEPDRRVRAFAADPWRASQWNLQGPDGARPAAGGIRVEAAWARSVGQGAVVGVIDSGLTEHPDLAGAWLPGYDLIAGDSADGLAIAGDGDGRDPDPSDPGSWCETTGRPSTWHGTAVAGIIAARADNGYGIAGIAPASAILPVRAIGRCGGYMSDVLDAMRWAAGLPVAGLPANPTPVRVLNVSLGGDLGSPCSTFEQATIDALAGAGALVIAAAGNEGSVGLPSPASCQGVVAVAAHERYGELAAYSNHHPGIALTAPGGSGTGEATAILTAGNSGSTLPESPLPARGFTGTSAAVPHVAAVAAMLLALEPSLSPDDLRGALLSSARPWPAGTRCASGDAVGQCGAGMLDAGAALAGLGNALSVRVTAPAASVRSGSEVVLTGVATSRQYGSGQLRHAWTQRSGEAAALTGADQPTVRVRVPARRGPIGLRLTVTDPAGREAIAETVIDVNDPPVVTAVPTLELDIGEPLRYRIEAVEPDGEALVFVLLEGPPGLGVSRDGGLLQWAAATEGRHRVRIRVTDASGLAAPDVDFEVRVGAADAAAMPYSLTGRGGGGALPLWPVAVGLLLLAGSRGGRPRSDR